MTPAEIVARVRLGDETAAAELYTTLQGGIRWYVARQLGPGPGLNDLVHDIYLTVLQSIQRGELRDPDRLMGFALTIAKRAVAEAIRSAIQERRHVELDEPAGIHQVADRRRSPEDEAIESERRALVIEVLDGLRARDREILTRFYLYEQTQTQICEEMSLSETQYRLLKSSAKARFGERGRRKLKFPQAA